MLGFRYAPCRFERARAAEQADASDQEEPPFQVRRACFRVRKVLEGVVYDTVALEGNPFTLPEVKTLIEGITVGGHRLEDADQVLNQAASWRRLLALVESGTFVCNRATFEELHALVAQREALTWGLFRTGSVTIAGTDYQPPPWQVLADRFEAGLAHLRGVESVHERAIAMFLFCALHQFFYDGNKRTGRLMMNGELLAAGHDAISIPARRRLAFNETMIRFYDRRDGSEMMQFMASCSLDETLKCIPLT